MASSPIFRVKSGLQTAETTLSIVAHVDGIRGERSDPPSKSA